jgi:hypothetical protein
VVFHTNMHTGALLDHGWSDYLTSRADAEMAHAIAKAVHADRKVLRHVGCPFLGGLVFAAASVAPWATALLEELPPVPDPPRPPPPSPPDVFTPLRRDSGDSPPERR